MATRHWTMKMTTKESNEILKELASYHAHQINDATVREYIVDCIVSDRFLDLCDYSPSYAELSVSDAINVRQSLAFFQKRADLELGIDKRGVAVGRFIEAERQCRLTNEAFESRSRGEFFFHPRVESVLHTAQRKIASILGDLPQLAELKLRFGPGATTQIKKKNASIKRKLSVPFSCSEDAIPLIREVLEELPKWVFPDATHDDAAVGSVTVDVEIHNGRLDFVRKSYKTDRAIVVEPMLNTLVQLGIGDYISTRLMRSGVNLKDQSINKRLAREGSISGDLATLDLSSASDTLSTGLVLDLLPLEWVDFLSHFRSSRVECDGYPIVMQKFSSMGNGFTFPLESLIFYALSWAATDPEYRERVSVYGDDIIVPTQNYELLCEVLVATGFTPNREKSFASGPFRESCGGDYLRGIDIRPCYIKEQLSFRALFVLHNTYVRRGDLEAARLVAHHIPKDIQKWGPDGYGDGHLISNNLSLTPHGRERGWSGYVFESYTLKPKKSFEALPGDRVYPFYAIYSGVTPEAIDREWQPTFGCKGVNTSISDRPLHTYDLAGRLGVTLPGAETYKLIKIYTLSPS